MKNTNLILSTILTVILVSVSTVFAQDKKMDMKPKPKGEMKMAAPQSVGPHALVMAHQRNALAFTQILWQMSADGKIADLDLARAAFGEIKRSIEKMDEIRQMHMSTMGKMDAAAMEKMKPMMEKMEADSAALKGHIQELESALQGSSPRVSAVEAHSAALLLRLRKMSEPAKKMAMPAKKMDMSGMKKGGTTKMDHDAMMMKNGEKAMGFSQTATTHHFLIMNDGGAIQVEANDAKDTASRDMIRAHLAEIAKQFKNGDFKTPFAVHGEAPAGVPVMKQLRDRIRYTYEETANGARVRIVTSDPQALAAIHAFLKYQIEEHKTGDPVGGEI